VKQLKPKFRVGQVVRIRFHLKDGLGGYGRIQELDDGEGANRWPMTIVGTMAVIKGFFLGIIILFFIFVFMGIWDLLPVRSPRVVGVPRAPAEFYPEPACVFTIPAGTSVTGPLILTCKYKNPLELEVDHAYIERNHDGR
jgi:hypothetical protein